MDDVQLANYFAGVDPGPIEAGRLDQLIAERLGVSAGSIIWLSDYTLTKIKFRHTEIEFEDYKKLPEILVEGFATPGNRARSVEICHIDTTGAKHKLWRICIKATRGSQVYLTMFHRLDLKEMRRLYRRANKRESLIRDHKNQLARRLLRRASGA